ncbi:putative RWD domain-containing protein 1 [Hypsibius exemplaris]|uniref:RWD domain-containing protein 1 n=1 Tax=Hypsibius exemplaris TaxID=2072580 RepID=A0A1W0W8F1_HYPEX|nr:putative RWD domain-containing protein 1 [Hypsibius exemplaris]
MDHKEEQEMEIESLLSIYPEELTILTIENTDPENVDAGIAQLDARPQFTLKISSSEAAASTDNASEIIATLWKFIFPPEYPDVIPEMHLLDAGDLPPAVEEALVQVATSTAEQNVGMASVFTIMAAIQDELNGHLEACLEQLKNISERAKREEEEADRRKMEGTRVSVESFIAWKFRFDAERKKLKPKEAELVGSRRLTGRQMFEENANLDMSDAQFMEEGDEAADIDDREGAALDEEFDHELFEQELLNEDGDSD